MSHPDGPAGYPEGLDRATIMRALVRLGELAQTADPRVLTAAAALVELLAQRTCQPPPPWAATVEPLDEPFFAVVWAERPGFTRELCLAESPEPLRRRNIFAPPNFLEMA